MDITNVQINKVESDSKLKAVSSITFDDLFVVHGVKIVEGENGLFIAMPSRKLKDGTYKDVFHPISKDARKIIEDAVLQEYNKI